MGDDWKFVVSGEVANASPLHKLIMKGKHTFLIDTTSPYAMKRMAEHLQKGGRLVLFPEGRITYTGNLMKLFDGTGFLVHKSHAKVITCYLRGADRLKFSRQPGWRQWFPQVTAHFSPILEAPKYENVRAAIVRTRLTEWLRVKMVDQQFKTEMQFGARTLPDAIVEMAAKTPDKFILEDVTAQPLTYRRLLVGAELLTRPLNQDLKPDAKHVGVLLPNIQATPVVLIALWALGRVPAILNFSTGMPVMLACSQLAGFTQIVTSRAFLEKVRIKPEPLLAAGIELIYLEDLRPRIGAAEKLLVLFRNTLATGSGIHGYCEGMKPSETAVILFTSGSEGVPKGVELTHHNILSNCRQILAGMDLEDTDRIFNALPIFHSFGLVVGTLLGLVRGMFVFLYPSPLHYRIIPSVLYDRNCTIFLSTNTFLNGYARRSHPYDFRSMRYLFAAAEKLQEATANTWMRQFGVRIMEGYGATECSPCITLITRMNPRFGSVGKLMPGMEYKIEPVEGVAEGGRLLVRGPNIMKGYLNADANEKFKALDGWYDTGDLVKVDEDGYFSILGRLKRFAKISGEMVSLTAVEDALAGAFTQLSTRCEVAVTTRPDVDKGEILVAVSNEQKVTLELIRNAVKAKGLTNLCAPRELLFLKEIPKLGTGKINHRELSTWVQSQAAPK